MVPRAISGGGGGKGFCREVTVLLGQRLQRWGVALSWTQGLASLLLKWSPFGGCSSSILLLA